MPINKLNWQKAKPELVNNNTVTIDPYYIKTCRPKKITASRFSAVLGLNKFNSQFKTWLMMLKLYDEPMDKTLGDAGNIIEDKLREYAEKKLKTKYKKHNVQEVWYDVFKDNEIFGGVPDGEPSINGAIDYSSNLPMLEIKTSSYDKFKYQKIDNTWKLVLDENKMPIIAKAKGKYDEWHDEKGNVIIPKEYIYQLSLYLYLRNISNGMFVVGFLQPEDYVNPNNFPVEKRIIKFINFKLNHKEFANIIDDARMWHLNHIKNGKCPNMSKEDIEFFNTISNEAN